MISSIGNQLNDAFIKEESGFIEIEIKGYEGVELTTNTIGLRKIGCFQIAFTDCIEKLNQVNHGYLSIAGESFQIEVGALSNYLTIDHSRILAAIENDQLEELVYRGVAAKYSKVSYQKFEKVDKEALENFRAMTEYGFSVKAYFTAVENKKDKQFLDRVFCFIEKCQPYFENLEKCLKLYNEVPSNKKNLARSFTELEKKTMKKTILSIVRVLDSKIDFPEEAVFQRIEIGPNLSLIAASTSREMSLIPLFGRIIGKGSSGTIIRTMDLLTGTWRDQDDIDFSVIKIPKSVKKNAYVRREVEILDFLNKGGYVIGIQRPIYCHSFGTMYKDKEIESTYQLGERYIGDIFYLKLKTNEQKLGVFLQLLYGVNFMHGKKITHFDIKLENILFDRSKKRPKEGTPSVYIADFEGAIDHNKPPNKKVFRWICSSNYTRKKEVEDIQAICSKKQEKYFEEMCHKVDINCICKVLIEIFYGQTIGDLKFPDRNGIRHNFTEAWGSKKLKKHLSKDLEPAFGKSVADLIIAGLNPKSIQRPTAKSLLDAVEERMGVAGFERMAEDISLEIISS